MDESILDSIKSAAGVNADDNAFDDELIMHINTVFMTLRQLGVGPSEPFLISDSSSVWNDFISDSKIFPMVKSYTSLCVRRLFDPPTSGALMTAIEKTIAEYEWRLNVEADDYKVEEDPKYAKKTTESSDD